MATQWQQFQPSQNLPLPSGWEAKYDPNVARYYFINHATRETTWKDPRLDRGGGQSIPMQNMQHSPQPAARQPAPPTSQNQETSFIERRRSSATSSRSDEDFSMEMSESERQQLAAKMKREFPNCSETVVKLSLDQVNYDEYMAREMLKLLSEEEERERKRRQQAEKERRRREDEERVREENERERERREREERNKKRQAEAKRQKEERQQREREAHGEFIPFIDIYVRAYYDITNCFVKHEPEVYWLAEQSKNSLLSEFGDVLLPEIIYQSMEKLKYEEQECRNVLQRVKETMLLDRKKEEEKKRKAEEEKKVNEQKAQKAQRTENPSTSKAAKQKTVKFQKSKPSTSSSRVSRPQRRSPLSSLANGPNATLVKGPNTSLVSSHCMSVSGPQKENRHGSNPVNVQGPCGLNAHRQFLNKGPEPNNLHGPQRGLVKGSTYAPLISTV